MAKKKSKLSKEELQRKERIRFKVEIICTCLLVAFLIAVGIFLFKGIAKMEMW